MIPTEKLAPYLAHGLQFYGASDVWDLYCLSIEGAVVLKNGKDTIVVHEANVGVVFKPILRPFTLFLNNSEWEKGYQEMAPKGWDASWHMSAVVSTKKSMYFFKCHFDVHGLIAEGLAEDATKTDIIP